MTVTNPNQRDQQTGNPYPSEQGGTFRPENEPEGADLGDQDEVDEEGDDNDRPLQPGENPTREPGGEDRRERDDDGDERPDNIGRAPLR